MSQELIGIITVGIALGGGLLLVMREIGDLRERMARLEGLFEGFTGRTRTQGTPE